MKQDKRARVAWHGLIFLATCLCGCANEPASKTAARRSIRLATTTSVENTGLLKKLLTPFTAETGIAVRTLAVGSGQALALARNGDVDVVLVHDQQAELEFVQQGHGVNRRDVMHNDFVLLGPAHDPAGIKGSRNASAAMAQIAAAEQQFISRGDNSGTHKAEQRLWKASRAKPAGTWYIEAGQGQMMTVMMAHEKQAYCLSDRGTYLSIRHKIGLQIMVEGDAALFNPYRIIPVNPARHPHSAYREAMALTAWLTSPAAQRSIAAFQVKGQTLFHPDAVPVASRTEPQ